MASRRLGAIALLAAACASPPADAPSGDSSRARPATGAGVLEQAPWGARPLPRDSVPRMLLTRWQRAENRATCALVAPASLADPADVDFSDAEPSGAGFIGGWGVAYGWPGARSVFGIAGTGSKATDEVAGEWPNTKRWADGSSAKYGPTDETLVTYAAHLRIEGQGCRYYVWSNVGARHVEFLLSQLRFVK